MSSKVDEHLDWLAMQYVLGELPDADRGAFEARLADEPGACEAVTAATRFILTARAALAQSDVVTQPELLSPSVAASRLAVPAIAPRPASRTARGGWLVVVATSAAIAVLCLIAVQSPDSNTLSRVASQDPAAAELVSLWRSGTDAADVDADDGDGDLTDDEVAVPGWMLAAVSFEAAQSIDLPSDKVQEN